MGRNQNDTPQKTSEQEILLAIATALHLETSTAEAEQQLTFTQEHGSWGYTGRLWRLSNRKNIQIRSRK